MSYDHRDGFDQLVEFVLVKHQDAASDSFRYFFFHAMQTVDDLVKHEYITDIANGKKQNKVTIRIPLPIEYNLWVLGKKHSPAKGWLARPRNGWWAPIE
eukprot:5884719-Prymnesium_polylepis.1